MDNVLDVECEDILIVLVYKVIVIHKFRWSEILRKEVL